jgi:AraC-like DNA-binding protein
MPTVPIRSPPPPCTNLTSSASRDSGYSEQHLRRRLVAATGHSPRKLARIGRMQAVLAAGRGESWARTAVDFGYYDESHMINDIRALAGATPQTILTERARAA